MNKNLINSIAQNLTDINHVIPNLNRGGCGVFAHALGSELEKNGFDVKIISLGFSRPFFNPNDIVENLKRTNKEVSPYTLHQNGMGLCHLLVEVNDGDERIYLDSNGINVPVEEDDVIEFQDRCFFIDGRMSVEDCGIIANIESGWNNAFDRTFVPKVYDFVKKKLSKIIRPNQLQLNFGMSI